MDSTYTYFLLRFAWELDSDVLQLVKKWLEPHLKRRILNEDYNKFIKYAESQFSVNFIRYLYEEDEIMMSRFGFKNNIDIDLSIRENGHYKIKPNTIYELHDEYNSHYYICGQSLIMRTSATRVGARASSAFRPGHRRPIAGISDSSRWRLINNFRYIRSIGEAKEIFDSLIENGNSEERKRIIRILMDKEEMGITNSGDAVAASATAWWEYLQPRQRVPQPGRAGADDKCGR
jgi:hypothetical protein